MLAWARKPGTNVTSRPPAIMAGAERSRARAGRERGTRISPRTPRLGRERQRGDGEDGGGDGGDPGAPRQRAKPPKESCCLLGRHRARCSGMEARQVVAHSMTSITCGLPLRQTCRPELRNYNYGDPAGRTGFDHCQWGALYFFEVLYHRGISHGTKEEARGGAQRKAKSRKSA